MANDNLPDFSGKLVILYLANAAPSIQEGTLLEYASFKEFGERLFIVGRVPSVDEDGQWVANLKSGVAWDSVNHYLIFDSREDYINRVSKAKIPFFQRILDWIRY